MMGPLMQTETKVVKANISRSLTGSELKCIKLFLKRAKELYQTHIVSGNKSKISSNIKAEKGSSVQFSVSLPDEEYLRSFYMAFRFFYLKKEKSHFLRITNIVKRRTDNELSKKYIEKLEDMWNGALARQQMQIYIDGKEITPTMLIDLWFNAHYFHSDEFKNKNLSNLKKALSINQCRFMLADAVYEASMAVLNLANSLQAFDG
jgi:hypothetical protein